MHQHYKVVFKEDIYNMKILTELTVSLLFALRLSNYLSVTSFMHDVLSVVRAHHHWAPRKFRIRIQPGHLFFRLSGAVFSPQWYGDLNVLWGRWWRGHTNPFFWFQAVRAQGHSNNGPPITRATLVYLNQTNSHRPHMHTCRLGGKNILSYTADRDEDQMPKLPRHLGLTVLTLIVEDVKVTYQRRQRNPD